MALPATGIRQPPANVRNAIRELLISNPAYRALDSATRLSLAHDLVRICATALQLADEAEQALVTLPASPLAQAQNAGSEFSGVATQKLADTARQVLNAVSFPRFVTELINGVFKALVDTNQQQMHSYVELIRNVAASTEGFAEANVGLNGARQWLAERYPGAFVIEGETDSWNEPGQSLSPEERAEQDAETRLRLRPGASMPSESALRLALGLGSQESLPGGDPENLVPLARNALARNRQQMLSTMVMLGLQRIVIESGRLNASMRFHIDTRSAAQSDAGSQFDFRNTTSGSGSFGYGPWGASASMSNTIGYVSTEKTQTTEEMNTDLNLDSSVELVFKTDYLPLDRLAGRDQVDRIKINTLNPEAERKADADTRTAREKRIGENDAKRRESLDKAIAASPPAPGAPAVGAPGSPEAAEQARKEAEERDRKKREDAGKKKSQSQPTATLPVSKPPASKEPGGQQTARKPAHASNGSGNTPTQVASSASLSAGEIPPSTASTPGQAHSSALPEPIADRSPDVIFVPTQDEAVDEMLALAKLRPGQLLFDLGCGDGRIVIKAARDYGCTAVGFDIDPQRVAEASANVAKHGLQDRVRIRLMDMFNADLSQADVVTAYLLPELNVRLIPRFATMKPGARIVSHDFDMAGVIPDRVVQVYLPGLHIFKTFYLWTTPLRFSETPVWHQWANSKGLTVAQPGSI